MNDYSTDPVSAFANLGTYFAGDTAPSVVLVLVSTNGGLINLSPVSGTSTVVDVTIRRWDPRRSMPLGGIVTSGAASVLDQTGQYLGWAVWDWTTASPVESVPTDPGWYVLQATVHFGGGTFQHTQRALFEVKQNA